MKPVAAWNPRQIATQNVDGESGSHEDSAYQKIEGAVLQTIMS